jgi:hypothetical protein
MMGGMSPMSAMGQQQQNFPGGMNSVMSRPGAGGQYPGGPMQAAGGGGGGGRSARNVPRTRTQSGDSNGVAAWRRRRQYHRRYH